MSNLDISGFKPVHRVDIEVVTPVHIGDGQKLDGLCYYADAENEFAYVFDFERLDAILDDLGLIEEFHRYLTSAPPDSGYSLTSFLDRYEESSRLGAADIDRIKLASRYRIKLVSGILLVKQEVLSCIKQNNGVYIPGSEIKGAIRTAIIQDLLGDTAFQHAKSRLLEDLADIQSRQREPIQRTTDSLRTYRDSRGQRVQEGKSSLQSIKRLIKEDLGRAVGNADVARVLHCPGKPPKPEKPIDAIRRDALRIGSTGSSLLGVRDIMDWPEFLSKLRSDGNTAQPSPGKRVWELLPPDIQSIAEESVGSSSLQEEQKSSIIKELNERILDSPDFYQEEYFPSVTILEEAQRLLGNQADLSSSDVQRLNRLLMESAYPHEIAKSRISEEAADQLVEMVNQYRGKKATLNTAKFQRLEQYTQSFKNATTHIRPEIEEAENRCQKELLGEGSDNMMRFVRIGDTTSGAEPVLVGAEVILKRERRSILQLHWETIELGTCFPKTPITLGADATILTVLGLTAGNARRKLLNADGLFHCIHKASNLILQEEKTFASAIGWQTQVVDRLIERNTPQAPLLRIGKGQGYLSLSLGLQIRREGSVGQGIYKDLLAPLVGEKGTPSLDFPVTRHSISTGIGKIYFPPGWIQLHRRTD